jgi:hypothetical protein
MRYQGAMSYVLTTSQEITMAHHTGVGAMATCTVVASPRRGLLLLLFFLKKVTVGGTNITLFFVFFNTLKY